MDKQREEKIIVPLHPSVGQMYASFWDIKNFLLAYHWVIVNSSEASIGLSSDHFFVCYDKDKKVCIVINIVKDNRKFIITNVRMVSYERFLKKAQLEMTRKAVVRGGEHVVI
jgi:hypothetical protein